MKTDKTRIILLTVLLTATIGAGFADMFTEVVPIRPYTGVFRFTPIEAVGRSSVMGEVLVITLIVLLVASLLVAVANRTTGIVIAHSGFTPNTNLTSTAGLPSVIQLFPLLFAFLGLAWMARYFKRDGGGGI